jgi:DNA-binding NtrC family response regulator
MRPVNQTAARSEPRSSVIAIVDEPSKTELLGRQLESRSITVARHPSVDALLASASEQPSLICVSVGEHDMSLLERLRTRYPRLPIIALAATPTVEWVVQAMRHGASDCFGQPLDMPRFVRTIELLVDERQRGIVADALKREATQLIGKSAAMAAVHKHIDRVADKDVPVCLRGETGTGKELATRAIHERSKRRQGPLIAINCAAIPRELQESEFFGHQRGAFTGAVAAHRGRFEQAHGGTLFLDEVGDMSPQTQAMFLRVIEERTIRRVGSATAIPVDVRLICATHRDLEAEVAAGRFREDLYFRLVVYRIDLPPLREREEDLPDLISHFVGRATLKGATAPRVSAEAMSALQAHEWPGNIRELQNVLTHAVLAADGAEIGIEHLPASVLRAPKSKPSVSFQELVSFREMERRAIVQAMGASGGNVNRAAKMLDLSRATVYRRLLEFAAPPNGENSD